MASATYPLADQSSSIVRKNMARIKLFTVAGPLLCHAAQANRVVRIVRQNGAESARYYHQGIHEGVSRRGVLSGRMPILLLLNMPYTDGMDVALNWEELADELQQKWRRYQYPINFDETSGLVEYDEWFTQSDGTGSMIQFVIDACAEADVTPSHGKQRAVRSM